jgi:hypothetical protein
VSTDLRQRLGRLRQQAQAAPPLRDRLARLGRDAAAAAPPRDDAGLARALGGEVLVDGVILVERRLADGAAAHPAAGLDDWPGGCGHAPRDWVLLDTETTGLAGGTGTLVFQIGMARRTAAGLLARQWLLTRIGAEAAMLQAARAWAAGAGFVSYNGKSFDVPLLAARSRLCRLSADWLEQPHLDLLHPVRRAFARCWPDCRLATVERRLLALARIDDLPGAAAPQAWLDYVRGGTREGLVRVLEHNLLDLLALARLLAALGRVYRAPMVCGADPAAVAGAWAQAGQDGRAVEVLQAAGAAVDRDARCLLGRLFKRAGRWEEAKRVWEPMAEAGDAAAAEQLAKYYEHVRRDYRRARQWAERLPAGAAAARRLARLARK